MITNRILAALANRKPTAFVAFLFARHITPCPFIDGAVYCSQEQVTLCLVLQKIFSTEKKKCPFINVFERKRETERGVTQPLIFTKIPHF